MVATSSERGQRTPSGAIRKQVRLRRFHVILKSQMFSQRRFAGDYPFPRFEERKMRRQSRSNKSSPPSLRSAAAVCRSARPLAKKMKLGRITQSFRWALLLCFIVAAIFVISIVLGLSVSSLLLKPGFVLKYFLGSFGVETTNRVLFIPSLVFWWAMTLTISGIARHRGRNDGKC